MQYREQWPLWQLEKKLYEEQEQVWVLLNKVPPMRQGVRGLQRLLLELARLEHQLLREGIYGWVAAIAPDNRSMCRAVELVGAKCYRHDARWRYYQKFAGVPQIPESVMQCLREARIREHRRATWQ